MSEIYLGRSDYRRDIEEQLRTRGYLREQDRKAMRAPWEAKDERFGGQPPVGAVLRWSPEGGQPNIAMRVQNGWQVAAYGDVRTWDNLCELIGDKLCHVAVGWREIPRPDPEPTGDDAVRDWAAQFLPESASTPVVVAENEEGDPV